MALILTLIISALMVTLPSANATDHDVYAFLSVAPSPIGVGQPAIAVMWLDMLPPLNPDGSQTAWEQLTVTINTPSGETETKGPFNSDAVASAYFDYTPTEVGTYVFQFIFPGQQTVDGNYYRPTTSPEVSLVVQAEPIEGWTPNPSPADTEYWNRPIYGENREWASIGGNWFGVRLTYGTGCTSSGAFNPYTTAPESAHVVWTKELAWGGIVGGDLGNGDVSYYTGLSYESKYGPPVIMQGKLFCTLPLSNRANAGGTICLDLRTGGQLWWQNITIDVGQIYDYESPNQHGALPYLWQTSASYNMFDPYTGELLLTLANASRGRVTMSPSGDLLVYVLDGQNNWIAMWNSSYAPYMYPGTVGTSAWQWRPPIGTTQDWLAGVQWNVTVPDVPGTQSIACIGEGVIIAASQADDTTIKAIGYDATTGAQKWTTDITSNAAFRPTYFIVPVSNGVFVFFRQETMEFYGYSIETGNLVWGPTLPYDNAWGIYTSSTVGLGASNPLIAYDTLYSVAYDGKLHAYSAITGDHLFDFDTGSAGFETPYGTYPLGSGTFAIADGKVYAATGEHSPNSPMWRGGRIYCVDAYHGTGIWNLTGWWQTPAIADGYLTAFNNYDCKIYCIGRGQTETTITAPATAVPRGAPVLIQGTILDQSPGACGTPAISDEYMTQWMEYLYMQHQKPENARGVELHLVAIDSNCNTHEIGTLTSDILGNYATEWTPPVSGLYTVIATFEGSKSYFSSQAGTFFVVSDEASPIVGTPTTSTSQATSPSPSMAVQPSVGGDATTTYVVVASVVIIIIVAVAAVLLRRRK